MAAGQLAARFTFQRNPPIYYGPRDVVHGNVILSFSQPASASQASKELSGPLRLEVEFSGTVLAHVDRSRPTLTRKTTLFTNVYVLHNDDFNILVGESKLFPFTASFPEYADDAPSNPESRLQARKYHLPPSFQCGSQDAWKKASGVNIEYEMKARIVMGGTDVNIRQPDSRTILTYEQQLPDSETTNATQMLENTWSLEIPMERAQLSSKEAVKNLVTDAPRYVLSAQCVGIPEHLIVGQRLAFDVQLRTTHHVSESELAPQITIEACEVVVRALTLLWKGDRVISKLGFTGDYRQIDEDIMVLHPEIKPDRLCSKQNGYSKSVLTEPLSKMSSSFTVGQISHQHRIRIRLRLRVHDESKEFGFAAECDVNMHAAPPSEYQSSLYPPSEAETEELPGYQ